MKKLSLVLVVMMTAVSACRKEVTQVSEADQAFSAVYDIQPADWSSSDGDLSYSTTFDVAELSDAIFDHGAVIVYLSFDNNIYEALPEEFGGISYGAVHSPGSVTVDMHAIDGGKINPPTGDVYGKIVLIDAQQLSLHPGLNLQDYNAVINTFHVR